MKIPSSKHVVYINCSECHNKTNICVHKMFLTCSDLGIFMYWTRNSMNNLLSYCGLVDAKIRASDKDLPVKQLFGTDTMVLKWPNWEIIKTLSMQLLLIQLMKLWPFPFPMIWQSVYGGPRYNKRNKLCYFSIKYLPRIFF